MTESITAVVLAGGVGNRFWPMSQDKLLFPFMGKTLFEHAVIAALPKTVNKIVVIANAANKEALSNLTFPVPHVIVVQKQALGMADALISAATEIAHSSLLILIADDLLEKHLVPAVLEKARSTSVFGVIPGWKTDQYFPGGYLQLDGERVTHIIEKPAPGTEPSRFVAISGQYIRSSDVLLEEIVKTKSETDDIYETALGSLMKKEVFVTVPYEHAFASVKYPWDILNATAFVLSGIKPHIAKSAKIDKSVIIEGPVVIEEGVRIFENTKIVGPCYIGRDTIIGNNNIIRDSHIGARCVTGFSTDITRSYVGDDCWFHTNYIGDSVLEGNVSMGSGAVLANLRLDDGGVSSIVKGEKVLTGRTKLGALVASGVRMGVNVSVMPGVKIGAHSFVGSGVVLDRDLPENMYCTVKQEYTIKPNITAAVSTTDREGFRGKI